jgi:hypothetical protein
MTDKALYEAAKLAALNQLTSEKLVELGAPQGAKIHFVAPLVGSQVYICARWRVDSENKGVIFEIPVEYIDLDIARNIVPMLYAMRKCAEPMFTGVMSYCRSQAPEVIEEWEAALKRLWGL